MTHKHIKFKRVQDFKYSRANAFAINDELHEERSRRVLLLSSEDVDRMAIESSRARLMMQLVSKPEETCREETFREETSREFGSYFRGKKDESNPVYIMTSHTSPIPIQKRIVPAYSSLVQGLRWSPSVKAYSEDSQTDSGDEDSSYTCRCQKCKSKHCPGRGLKTENVHRRLKDNIMKFSDNSTMTPKLTDIACGAHSPLNPIPITSKVSMATSNIVVQDQSLVLPQNYKITPIPILKKFSKSNDRENIENNLKPRVTVTLHEAVKDTNNYVDNDQIFKPLHTQDTIPCCPNNSENSSDCEYVRKVIYNEGISDLIKKNTHVRYPVAKLPSMRLQSPTNVKRNSSKVSIKSKGIDKETIIPYAHRMHSKYHSHCQPSLTKSYRCEIDEDNIHSIDSPPVFRRTCSKAIRCTRIPSIRLPKKMLTSERDIEAFVDKRKPRKKCSLCP